MTLTVRRKRRMAATLTRREAAVAGATLVALLLTIAAALHASPTLSPADPVIRAVAVSSGFPTAPPRLVVDPNGSRAVVVAGTAGTPILTGGEAVPGVVPQRPGLWSTEPSWYDIPAFVVDTRTGAVVDRPTLGADIAALAVDRSSGQVVAVDGEATRTVLLGRGRLAHREVPLSGIPRGAVVLASTMDSRTGRLFAAVLLPPAARTPLQRPAVAVIDASGALTRLTALPRRPALRFGAGKGVLAPVQPWALALDAQAGRVFVFENDGGLAVLDAEGRLVRRRRLPAPVRVVAVDDRSGRIFAASSSGNPFLNSLYQPTRPGHEKIFVLASGDGALVKTIETRDVVTALAIDVSTNRLFASSSQRITMYDATTGHATGRVTAPDDTTLDELAVDLVRGRVYAAGAAGTSIQVLDARTGAPVRVLALGQGRHPIGLSVDAASGRLLVLSVAAVVAPPIGTPPDHWAWIPAALRPYVPFVPAPAPTVSAAMQSVLAATPSSLETTSLLLLDPWR